ncbi:hypothetical protein PanWU01x14_136520, partial [Parasponia andersonii]
SEIQLSMGLPQPPMTDLIRSVTNASQIHIADFSNGKAAHQPDWWLPPPPGWCKVSMKERCRFSKVNPTANCLSIASWIVNNHLGLLGPSFGDIQTLAKNFYCLEFAFLHRNYNFFAHNIARGLLPLM